jgi:hypothetical protein
MHLDFGHLDGFDELVLNLKQALDALKLHEENMKIENPDFQYEETGVIRIEIHDKNQVPGKHGIRVTFNTDIINTLV